MSDPTKLILDKLAEQDKKIDAQAAKLADWEKKAAERKGRRPSEIFHAATGPVGEDSKPYSLLKMVGVTQKWHGPEYAKNEIAISDKLGSMYDGFKSIRHHPQSILVPFSTFHLPQGESDADSRFLAETKARLKGWNATDIDEDQADWISEKTGMNFGRRWQKVLGTVSDAAGGVLVGFPTLGELIELQRNLEVFPKAGAQEIALPPNGRIQYPKQTSGSTAYWVGEAAAITESTQATGYLNLEAKKLGVFCKLNNELLRFTSPTTEALVRMDMALQAALKADLGMLEGTGGTQIKGITTYDTQSSWTQGTDKLITYSVTSNLFQPNDPADMEAVMPDQAGDPTAFLMRRNLWAKIRNRRADAVTTADGKGPFVFNLIREAKDGIPLELEGIPVIRSSQISNTRQSGSPYGGTQTYVLLGNFRDWLIGRFGVMEFLVSGLGDTPFQYDQQWVRGIQHIDAGARHAASFVLADVITIS